MIVIDASALVKLVVDEEDSEIARSTYKKELSERERIIVPNIILAESLSVLWKYCVLKKELTHDKYEQAVNDLLMLFGNMEKISDDSVAKYASTIAETHKISPYDALYVAVSRLTNAPFLSFDGKITRKAKELEIRIANATEL